MLFIHEVHDVVGKRAAEFEAAYREEWMPALADGPDARLVWYFDLAHGTGLSYRVVTVTAVADGAAWADLAERVAVGDLQAWARRLDGLQHRSRGRVLAPLDWSPSIGTLADIPTGPVDHEPTIYMEDTMWPFPGQLDEYVEAAGAVYRPTIGAEGAHVGLSIQLAVQTMAGAGRHPEVTLLQRLPGLPPLLRLLTEDLPAAVTGPGSWMQRALGLRDQWQSRLLRTAPWSPLP